MFKPFALFFFVLCCVWAGSIVVTTDPHTRLNRAVAPIGLAGKASVAAMVQIEPSWAPATYNAFLKLEHGTKYMLWSMFYEEDWRAAQQGGASGKPPVEAPPAIGAPPSVPASAPSGPPPADGFPKAPPKRG